MPEYLIHPKAPLLFRNAKPFASGEGSAETLPFPSPATISGALRTAWAEQQNLEYSAENAEKLLGKQVLGPLLVSLKQDQQQVLFPAPRDSVCLYNENNEAIVHRLVPKSLTEDEGCDLPNDELAPLCLKISKTGKPAKEAPAFWYQDKLVEWLSSDDSTSLSANGFGVGPLPIEYRTHVAVSPNTYTAKDAHLFETAGLDFSQRQQHIVQPNGEVQRGWSEEAYALLASFNDEQEIRRDLRTVGGESRLAGIEKAQKGLWPCCPGELKNAFDKAKGFRLYLATPAIFNKGWLPERINANTLEGDFYNLKVKLRAAAIPRWEAGTSWDMTKSAGGKGMRKAQRMVPAGAVYWFEVISGSTMELCDSWLTSISDERENDGFGLVLPGVWNPNS